MAVGGRRIPVTVEADTDGDFDRAARGLDDVAKSGDNADKALSKLTKGHVALTSEIDKTKDSVKALREEFVRTGDIGLLGDIDKQERSLKRLRAQFANLASDLTPKNNEKIDLLNFALDEALAKGFRKAQAATGNLLSSIGDSMAKNPIISTAIVAGVTVGAPAITAVIGGAVASGVTLGFGGGVIAAGIKLASKDSRVGDAWSLVFDGVQTTLDHSASSFVEPLVKSAGIADRAWGDFASHVQFAFEGLAPLLVNLSTGAAGFLHNIGPGLNQLTEAAKPFVQILAEYLPELGTHLGDFFATINRNGPSVEAFFNDVLDLVNFTVDALGFLVDAGSRAYDVFSIFGSLLTGNISEAQQGFVDLVHHVGHAEASYGGFHNKTIDVSTALGLLSGSALKAADGTLVLATDYAGLIKTLNQTEATAETVHGAMADKIFNSLLSADQASLGLAQSQLQLGEAFKDNGPAIDANTGTIALNTQAGLDNRQAIMGAIQANIAQYDSMIKTGFSAAEATAAYNDNTGALERQLRQAHLTQEQIDGLIGKYRNVPNKVDTDIAVKGLTEAITDLNDLIRKVNGLDGRVARMTVEEIHRTTYTNDIPPSQFFKGVAKGGMRTATGIRHAAAGLVLPPRDPGTVLAGEPETGGEVLTPLKGISQQRAMSLTQLVGDRYGFDVVPRRSGYASPVSVGSGGGRGGNTYQITNYVAPGASPAEVGAATVAAIKAYESTNGTGWRGGP